MFGAVVGDTIGSTYEFHNTKDYNFELFPEGSSFTDDSIMTIAVAEWLLKDREHSYQKLEDIMLQFANKYPYPTGGYGSGFLRWLFCPETLNVYGHREDKPYISNTGRCPYNSFGNGAAMRVSAVGWFFNTLEETERIAAISAKITHNHPEGIKGAQVIAAVIWMARNNYVKEDIRNYIEQKYGYDLHKTYDYWYSIYKWDGSCQGTVPQAIIAFLDSNNFEDAIRKAVSLGGDSDTLTCITGSIAEAYYKNIPYSIWKNTWKKLPEFLKNTIKEFSKIAIPIKWKEIEYYEYLQSLNISDKEKTELMIEFCKNFK